MAKKRKKTAGRKKSRVNVGKRRKLSGAALKAFLRRMAKGRAAKKNAGRKRKTKKKKRATPTGPVQYRKVRKTGWIKATAVRFLGRGRVQVKR